MGMILGRVFDRFEGGLNPVLKGMAGHFKKGAQIASADGARYEERQYANHAGSRSFKLYIPSSY
jgi:hypothetical protein